MKNQLVITRNKNQIISSLLEEEDFVQINVEPVDKESRLGNIYLGKVKNIVKNINAAFVEIEGGQMCYFSLGENKDPIFANAKKNSKVNIGDEIVVQISREDVKTKAPVVTSKLNFTGKYFVLTSGNVKLSLSKKIQNEEERTRLKSFVQRFQNQEYGFIVRTNASNVPEERLEIEIDRLMNLYHQVKEYGVHKGCFSRLYKAPASYLCFIRDGVSKNLDRIITDDQELYEEIEEYLRNYQKEDLEKLTFYEDKGLSLNNLYSISTKLTKALQEKIWLKSGGTLFIQPTEALTVIDVNTGKAITGKKNTEETFFKLNMEAAQEIAKQICLRNISGIIIIDFIDMEEEHHRDQLLEYLRELFRKDPIKTILVDMTALGLVEVTRKKVRKPLYEQIKSCE